MTFFQLYDTLHETDRDQQSEPSAPESALFFHPSVRGRESSDRRPRRAHLRLVKSGRDAGRERVREATESNDSQRLRFPDSGAA